MSEWIFIIISGFLFVLYAIGKLVQFTEEFKHESSPSSRDRKKRNGKKANKITDQLATNEQIKLWKVMQGKTYKDYIWKGELLDKEYDFRIKVVSMGYERPIVAYSANLYKMTCTCPDFKQRRSKYKKGLSKRLCKHLGFLFEQIEHEKINHFIEAS